MYFPSHAGENLMPTKESHWSSRFPNHRFTHSVKPFTLIIFRNSFVGCSFVFSLKFTSKRNLKREFDWRVTPPFSLIRHKGFFHLNHQTKAGRGDLYLWSIWLIIACKIMMIATLSYYCDHFNVNTHRWRCNSSIHDRNSSRIVDYPYSFWVTIRLYSFNQVIIMHLKVMSINSPTEDWIRWFCRPKISLLITVSNTVSW